MEKPTELSKIFYRSVAFRTWSVGEASRIFNTRTKTNFDNKSNCPSSLLSVKSEELNLKTEITTKNSFLHEIEKNNKVQDKNYNKLKKKKSKLLKNTITDVKLENKNQLTKEMDVLFKNQFLDNNNDNVCLSNNYLKYHNQNFEKNNVLNNDLCQKNYNLSLNGLNNYVESDKNKCYLSSCYKFSSQTMIKSEIVEENKKNIYNLKNNNSLNVKKNKNDNKIFNKQLHNQKIDEKNLNKVNEKQTAKLITRSVSATNSDRINIKKKIRPDSTLKSKQTIFENSKTKSFDNITRYNVMSTSFSNQNFPSTSKNQYEKQFKTLEIAKKLFQKIYSTSTLKFKTKNKEKTAHFQSPMSPFFEMRLPNLKEIPYLPYNVYYQIEENDEDKSKLKTNIENSTNTDYSFSKDFLQNLKTTSTNLLKYSSKSFKKNEFNKNFHKINYVSPDEGIYTASSSDSGSGKENTTQITLNTFSMHKSVDSKYSLLYDNKNNFDSLLRQRRYEKKNILNKSSCQNLTAKIVPNNIVDNQLKSLETINFLNDNSKNNFLPNTHFCAYDNDYYQKNCNFSNLSLVQSEMCSLENNNCNVNDNLKNIMISSTSTLVESELPQTLPFFNKQKTSSSNINNLDYYLMTNSLCENKENNNKKIMRSSSVGPNTDCKIFQKNQLNSNNIFNDKDALYQNKKCSSNNVYFSKNNTNNYQNNQSLNLNELFQCLKNEINDMRISDAQMWRNLKTLEKELSIVVNQSR